KRKAPAIPLDHGQLAQLDALEGGEPRAAGIALPAPAHRPALLHRPRVLDLVVVRAAERTAHGLVSHPRAVDRKAGAQPFDLRTHAALDRAVIVGTGDEAVQHLDDHAAGLL